MVYHCAYGDCTSNSKAGKRTGGERIKFYHFPQPCLLLRENALNWTDAEETNHITTCEKCSLANTWLIKCKRADSRFRKVRNISPHHWICSKHFDETPDKIDYQIHFPSERAEKNRKSLNASMKKCESASKSSEDLNGIVGVAMNYAFMAKADYISSGVPAAVLESKVSGELSVRFSNLDTKEIVDKCKELIATEIDRETLIKNDSGHYSFGPVKIEVSTPASSMNDDENSISSSYNDELEEDEDDGLNEKPKLKRHRKEDKDYEPPSNVPIKRAPQGRTSSRTIKSRFDTDEFVFPTLLRLQKNRKRTRSPEPDAGKSPIKKPGMKTKQYCCAECGKAGSGTTVSIRCKSCNERAHRHCLVGESKTNWSCFSCKMRLQAEWKCSVCENPPKKDLGLLIRCVICDLKYHRSCHKPVVNARNLRCWKCSSCDLNKTKNSPTVTAAESTPNPSKFAPDSLLCSKCKGPFPNSNDKLTCINCYHRYHSACCRVREVSNILRLGSRKEKWRCDHCVLRKPTRGPNADSSDTPANIKVNSTTELSLEDLKLQKEIEEEEERELRLRKMLDLDHSKDNTWWKYRLRKIVVGPSQPPLGPIPDLSVPDYRQWTCTQVQEYFDSYFEDDKIGKMFVENDVDGKAFRLLRRADVESLCLDSGLKIDITMDVIAHVKRLQLRVNDRRYIWADIF